jgi:hypothetical protein
MDVTRRHPGVSKSMDSAFILLKTQIQSEWDDIAVQKRSLALEWKRLEREKRELELERKGMRNNMWFTTNPTVLYFQTAIIDILTRFFANKYLLFIVSNICFFGPLTIFRTYFLDCSSYVQSLSLYLHFLRSQIL